jgi:hypothetical protein
MVMFKSFFQVGKNYLCPEWKRELITFSQFLARIEVNDCSSADRTYLAQHPLFDQVFMSVFMGAM